MLFRSQVFVVGLNTMRFDAHPKTLNSIHHCVGNCNGAQVFQLHFDGWILQLLCKPSRNVALNSMWHRHMRFLKWQWHPCLSFASLTARRFRCRSVSNDACGSSSESHGCASSEPGSAFGTAAYFDGISACLRVIDACADTLADQPGGG